MDIASQGEKYKSSMNVLGRHQLHLYGTCDYVFAKLLKNFLA